MYWTCAKQAEICWVHNHSWYMEPGSNLLPDAESHLGHLHKTRCCQAAQENIRRSFTGNRISDLADRRGELSLALALLCP